jgi:LacI family transcriptional regulator
VIPKYLRYSSGTYFCTDSLIIDFLICQKPQEQAYRGVMALYQHLAFAIPVEKKYFMPIDIITKENYTYYRN